MSDEASTDLDNQRRFERLSICGHAVLAEVDEYGAPSAYWRGEITNLSRGGLGLRSRRMVVVGRSLVIEAIGRTGKREKVLFGVVRQCRLVDGGMHALGVQFEHLPTSSPLEAYLRRWRDRVA